MVLTEKELNSAIVVARTNNQIASALALRFETANFIEQVSCDREIQRFLLTTSNSAYKFNCCVVHAPWKFRKIPVSQDHGWNGFGPTSVYLEQRCSQMDLPMPARPRGRLLKTREEFSGHRQWYHDRADAQQMAHKRKCRSRSRSPGMDRKENTYREDTRDRITRGRDDRDDSRSRRRYHEAKRRRVDRDINFAPLPRPILSPIHLSHDQHRNGYQNRMLQHRRNQNFVFDRPSV